MTDYIHELTGLAPVSLEPREAWPNGWPPFATSRAGCLGAWKPWASSSVQEAVLRTLTADVLKSSEIEGEKLDAEQVRSSDRAPSRHGHRRR